MKKLYSSSNIKIQCKYSLNAVNIQGRIKPNEITVVFPGFFVLFLFPLKKKKDYLF